MKDYKVMGERLKDLRRDKMLTLQQLSELSGISAGYISKIERGTVNPSIKNIQKLCFALEITANELMIGDSAVQEASRGTRNRESYVLTKEDRLLIYGITNYLNFESIYEENPNFKINVMTLAAGMPAQSYSVHSHDEFGIVARGILGIELNDEKQYELKEGECIMIRANTKHAVTNCSSEECITYWIEM